MKRVKEQLLFMCLVIALVVGLAAVASGTVSQVIILNGTLTEIYECTYSADSDTTCTLTHGLGAIPNEMFVQPLDANCMVTNGALANAAGTQSHSGMPYISTNSTTQVVVSKNTVLGSATCKVRVTLRTTHSIIQ